MFKRLALERQFDLGDDQSIVFAMKDVDLPHLVSDSLLIPRLLDERALAQTIEDDLGVVSRNRILEFESTDVLGNSFQGQKSLAPGNPHADHALHHR